MGSPYEITQMPRSHEAAWPYGFGVVRVYSPLEVRTKSPERFGHVKLPSSSRAHTCENLENMWVIPRHAV